MDWMLATIRNSGGDPLRVPVGEDEVVDFVVTRGKLRFSWRRVRLALRTAQAVSDVKVARSSEKNEIKARPDIPSFTRQIVGHFSLHGSNRGTPQLCIVGTTDLKGHGRGFNPHDSMW
jgi:hypothetical protein